MQLDSDDVCRSFPWVKELWLFGPDAARGPQPDVPDILVVSSVPPREVRPGQRKHLLAQLQGRTDRRLDLRLTTSEQLAKWLARGGRFAIAFRKRALKLFERPAGGP